MATYVLVHGARTAAGVTRGSRILREAGHEVYTPTMTGVGERAHLLRPGIDLDFHIEDIIQVLEYEDPPDTYIHTYMVQGAVEELRERDLRKSAAQVE